MIQSFPYRILLVDDEPSLRDIGWRMLTDAGYEVMCANDGFEGLAALRRALPDIIISDLHMPRMNGIEFLCVVRKRFPSVPVLSISSEFCGLEQPPADVCADAVLGKGCYPPQQLFDTLRRLLQERPVRDGSAGIEEAACCGDEKDAMTCPECLRSYKARELPQDKNQTPCGSGFCSFQCFEPKLIDRFPSEPERKHGRPPAG
jgi:CheY-like chemotaxis protein